MDIKIDSHKINYHPLELGKWMKGEKVFPITVEISPSGMCNHRCKFCSQSYLGYPNRTIDKDILLKNLKIMYDNGTKGIVLAGEGEPLIHPEIAEIIKGAYQIGLDVALSTNGSLLTEELSKEILQYLTWIRISFNGSSSENYSAIHNVNIDEYGTVLKNVKNAVMVKKQNELDIHIGIQYVLIKENANMKDLGALINEFKSMDINYFSIKPYSAHPLSTNNIEQYEFKDFKVYQDGLESKSNENFKVLIRKNAISRMNKEKGFNCCHGIVFWAYIDSGLDVWPCLAYIGLDNYKIGNLKEKTYLEIIESEQYDCVIERFKSLDISKCRKMCRLESINEYLHSLKEGAPHSNFI